MTELEKSLIEWVNANNISKLVTAMDDLTNGLILYQLMQEVAPRQFQNISLTDNDLNWSAKLRNLKQVFNGIEQFYELELGIECDRIVQDLNLANIARNSDTRELAKLMELVVGAAVSCEGKETYISRLSTLSEASQAQLMFFIEKVLEKFDYKRSEQEEKKETQKLRHFNRKIAIELQEVQDELALLEINHSKVTKERDQLRTKSNELEKSIPQGDGPSLENDLGREYEAQLRKKDAE